MKLLSLATIIFVFQAPVFISQKTSAPEYRNDRYGITLPLPESRRGFSVVMQSWRCSGQSGPVIVLRHPKWTAKIPYQDIPILVFTRAQWDAELNGKLSLYAGGVEYELGHNDQYVSAIYSRFNADDSVKGWKEVNDFVDRLVLSNRSPIPR